MTESYRGPFLSILASPHLLGYPADVLEWLEDRLGEDTWAVVLRAAEARRP